MSSIAETSPSPPRVPVLVAEDSEDSRFLLQSYCDGTAYEVTFAENGERAVDVYQTGIFNIVVMDVQMPVMDGLSAARIIRTIESERRGKRTPILALSASALPTDIVLALEAGCDLHLAKPISRKGFLRALEQWKPTPPSADPPAPLKIPVGMEQQALSYVMARQLELPLFQDLCRQSKFDKLRRLGQNLSGTGVGYGLPEIARLGANIERAALGRDMDTLLTNVAALAAHLDFVSREIKKICQHLPDFGQT